MAEYYTYPLTKELIGKIIKHWYDKESNPTERLYKIYCSFTYLAQYLRGENIESADKLYMAWNIAEDDSVCKQLISYIEDIQTPPIFFHTVIIIEESYELVHLYGDAYLSTANSPGFCMNKNMAQKSIWHETAHVLGANDHYDENTKLPLSICTESHKCFMQWDAVKGSCFCSKSIEEINQYLACIR
jgi:hypothetical protein